MEIFYAYDFSRTNEIARNTRTILPCIEYNQYLGNFRPKTDTTSVIREEINQN